MPIVTPLHLGMPTPIATRLRNACTARLVEEEASSEEASSEHEPSECDDRMSTTTAGDESSVGGGVWDAAVSYCTASLQHRVLRALRQAVAVMAAPRAAAVPRFRFHRLLRVWTRWCEYRHTLEAKASTHLRRLLLSRSLRGWVRYMRATARRLRVVLELQRRCRLRVLRRVWGGMVPYLLTRIRHGQRVRSLLQRRWTARALQAMRFWRELAACKAHHRRRIQPLRRRLDTRWLRECAVRWHGRAVKRLLLKRVLQRAADAWEELGALPSHAALFQCAGRCLQRWWRWCLLRRELRTDACALHAASAHWRVRALCGCWAALRSLAVTAQRRRRVWVAEQAAAVAATAHRERRLQATVVWVLRREVRRCRAVAAHFVRWRMRRPATAAFVAWRDTVAQSRRLVAATAAVQERQARHVLHEWRGRRADAQRRRWLLATGFAALRGFESGGGSSALVSGSDGEELPTPSTPRSNATEPKDDTAADDVDDVTTADAAPSVSSPSEPTDASLAEESNGGVAEETQFQASPPDSTCCTSVLNSEQEEEAACTLSPHQWRMGLRALAAWKVATTFRCGLPQNRDDDESKAPVLQLV